MDIFSVVLTRKAQKDLRLAPKYILEKLQLWVDLVESDGLRESRKIKSFHDEPLKGKRIGQRSIRLNRAYRAIYVEKKDKTLEFVEIQEVNKHDY